jgi:hypothetical protein
MNTTKITPTRENRIQFMQGHEGSWISQELAVNVQNVHAILHSLGSLLQPTSSDEDRTLESTDLAGLSALFLLLSKQIERINEEI